MYTVTANWGMGTATSTTVTQASREHGVEVRANRPQRQDVALSFGAEINVSGKQVMHRIEDLARCDTFAFQGSV